MLVYPERSQVHIKSGEEILNNYSFGIKRNLHEFCENCGSSVFFDPRMADFGEAPPDLQGINVSFGCFPVKVKTVHAIVMLRRLICSQGVKMGMSNVMHVEDSHPQRS